MPVIAEWATIGLVSISFIVFFKWLVLTTPLQNVPGLSHVAGSV
jgi:hypothetical protein